VIGQRNQPFQIRLKPAMRGTLKEELEVNLPARQAAVLDYAGSVADFRLFEISSDKPLASRFIFAKKQNSNEASLDTQPDRPEMVSLENQEKGKQRRFAMILGREDRYQLQLFSPENSHVIIRARDPRENLELDQTKEHSLRLGEVRFYQLTPRPGQTTTFSVTSKVFDPSIKLFDDQGMVLSENDDFNDELNSRLRNTSYTNSPLILAVHSVGRGGSGSFELSVQADVPKPIVAGEAKTQIMGEAGSELWLYTAKQSEQVIFYCKSSSPVSIVVKNVQGVIVGSQRSDEKSGGAVMLIKFPDAGDYSIEASLKEGREYSLQAIGAG
jgi:hypothetical protein